VSQSIGEGHATEPKTRPSKGAGPFIRLLARMLDSHRLRCGNPAKGPIFAATNKKPVGMNNVLNRVILPALDRRKHCKVSRAVHRKADHKYERDASRPRWHAARRGLGSNLYRLGVPEIVIQRILRHANVSTTASYSSSRLQMM